MSELRFEVVEVVPEPYAATPMLTARLRVEELSATTVHAIALRCQVRIEPQRRPYGPADVAALGDLFGERARWSSTLKPFLWMHTTAMVRGFRGSLEFDLPLPCTYDFEVAASKYLHAVRDGDIPLSLMFSGTVFTRGATDFQVEQIPWHSDVRHRLPARVWQQAMDAFFPQSGWIRIGRPTLDALQRFKSERGLTTWEQAFDAMLGAVAPPRAAMAVTGADGPAPMAGADDTDARAPMAGTADTNAPAPMAGADRAHGAWRAQ